MPDHLYSVCYSCGTTITPSADPQRQCDPCAVLTVGQRVIYDAVVSLAVDRRYEELLAAFIGDVPFATIRAVRRRLQLPDADRDGVTAGAL